MPSIGVLLLDDSPKWNIEDPSNRHFADAFPLDDVVYYETAKKGEMPSMDSHDAFILTGSHYNLTDEATRSFPWVLDVQKFLRAILEPINDEDPDAPVIRRPRLYASCFGCQLISFTFGGGVGHNPGDAFVIKNEVITLTPAIEEMSWAKSLVHTLRTNAETASAAAATAATAADSKPCEPSVPASPSGASSGTSIATLLSSSVEEDDGGCTSGAGAIDVPHTVDNVPANVVRMHLLESHGDCVTDLPQGATWLATSASCRNEMYLMGRNILAMQSHPEFLYPSIISDDILPDVKRLTTAEVEETLESLKHPQDSRLMCEAIREFLFS